MKHSNTKPIQVVDWGVLDYGEALIRQHQLVSKRKKGLCPDHLILVEHPPAVTLGRSGTMDDLRVPVAVLEQKGVCLHHVDRGGKATFHGPGQLVVYPIVNVEHIGIYDFLEQLLGTVADVLKDFGLVPEYQEGKPGLWLNQAKVASVGLSVEDHITCHGIALNVTTDPSWFDLIDPCGSKGGKITAMNRETKEPIDISKVKKRVIKHFADRLDYAHPFSTALDKTGAGPGKRPQWLVKPADDLDSVQTMEKKLKQLHLATVCQSAHCPNLGECFHQGNATFMILGTRCTRRCRFCAVDKGLPFPVDRREPERVAAAVKELGLTHAVVTSVTRDDLSDGGAGHFSRTIDQIRIKCPNVSVEVLVPDFKGNILSMDRICTAHPDVFNHNIETVPRLYPSVRPIAEYRQSLGVLSYASSHGLVVKSGLMLGLGETSQEVEKTLLDLKYSGCSLLTIGQYLAPSAGHAPMTRYVLPEEFEKWDTTARAMGFTNVASGPLVRSSYHAGRMIESSRNVFRDNPLGKAG